MERRGRAYLDQERGCICLQPILGGEHFYEIDKRECQTPEQAAEWIAHLHEKNWGQEVMPDFLRVLTKQFSDLPG